MKEKILQTSLEQFLKFGIRKMSIQRLVSPLGISTKTVYKYFKNKEELLKEVLNLHYNQQYQLLEKLSENQNAVTLFYDIWHQAVQREFGINNIFFRDLHYYYPELERKTEAEIGDKFWKKIQQIILNGRKHGFFREDIHPLVTLEGIAVLLEKVGRSEQFQKFNQSSEEIFFNTILVYIRGFCTLKGLEELDKHTEKSKQLNQPSSGKRKNKIQNNNSFTN
jgi:AcrR family transcriptional regulator